MDGKTMVELTKDLWVDPVAIVRVAPIERKAGLAPQCRIYFDGAASGVPVDLSVRDVIGKLAEGLKQMAGGLAVDPTPRPGDKPMHRFPPQDRCIPLDDLSGFDLLENGTRIMDAQGLLGFVDDDGATCLLMDGTTRWLSAEDLLYPVRILAGPHSTDIEPPLRKGTDQ